MLAILERFVDSARRVTTGRAPKSIPPQGMLDYEVTDEGCAQMRDRLADSFAGKDWDDVNRGVRPVGSR